MQRRFEPVKVWRFPEIYYFGTFQKFSATISKSLEDITSKFLFESLIFLGAALKDNLFFS